MPLGIAVRAGLHTGECTVMGDDIGGIAVHIGARVAAFVGAGEVLVSSTVKGSRQSILQGLMADLRRRAITQKIAWRQ